MNFEEQIMFKEKYASIFSRQMEAVMFIILQISFATRAVLKFGEYHLGIPQSWNIQSHDALRSSSASKNIWWIIIIITK